MSAFNNNNNHNRSQSAMGTFDPYGPGSEEHSLSSVPYSKDNIPIGHLTSHLEDLSTNGDIAASRTAPPTPAPYMMPATQMRAMSDTSLFIPDTVSSDQGSDDVPLIARSSTQSAKNWEERGAAKIVTTEMDVNGNMVTTIVKKSVKDFKFGKSLGEGSYSTVVLATDKTTGKNYAIKVLDKRHIIREKKVKYVNIEKNTLNRLGKRNGIITMYFTFQDEASLYFVLDYAPNGELLSLIKKHGSMNEESVKYYCAQILDGIKYMHDNGVVHRDIKPENILIDSQMRAQITDFGTAKLLEPNSEGRYPPDAKATSFVGTAEYVSPELLNDKHCGKPCDIWAFGCIMYQMIAGKPPFKATNEYLTFQKVCKLQYAFTAGFPLIVRDLIKKILVLQPSNRATVRKIQEHYFFSDIDWSDHESIFDQDPPELGPYKVTARSMMPVPELSQQSINRVKPHKKSTQTQQQQANSSSHSLGPLTPKIEQGFSSGSQSAPQTPLQQVTGTPASRTTPKSAGKNTRSASSAAAAALAKTANDIAGQNDSGESDSTPPVSAGSSTPATKAFDADLYIPGTNILRPTVKSRVISTSSSSTKASSGGNNYNASNRVATSTNNRASSRKKSATKAITVTPMTQVDLAWSQYLKHRDERVLKVGHVLASQTTTEQFEKKYKGMLAESPLGYMNGRRSSNASQHSLLSQIANGQHPGLRRGNSANLLGYISTITENENDTAFVYNTEDDDPDNEKEKQPEVGKFRKVFKNLGTGGNTNSSSAVDQAQDRTMLITSFGRALLFKLNKDRYELRTEIDLTNPSVKFKEIIGDRRVKNLITNGVFAIESLKITLMFEVEKQDVITWTTSLAKSKDNQEERIALHVVESEMGSATNASNALTAAAIAAMGSPKNEAANGNEQDISELRLNSAEVAAQIQKYDMKTLSKLVQSTRSPRGSMDEYRGKDQNGSGSQQHKMMESRLKRKPPPSSYKKDQQQQQQEAAAAAQQSSDNYIISAAINKALQNKDIKPSSTNRSSSFSRGSGGGVGSYFFPQSNNDQQQQQGNNNRSSSGGKNDSSPSNNKSMITSINSKFLQRSQRKK